MQLRSKTFPSQERFILPSHSHIHFPHCFLHRLSSTPSFISSNHWSVFYLNSFIISRKLHKWNHTSCNLLGVFDQAWFSRDSSKLCISIVCSFSLLNSISWYGYTTFYLSTEGQLGFFQFPAIIKKLCMNLSGFFVSSSFLWNKYPGVQLPGHLVITFGLRNCQIVLQSGYTIWHAPSPQ